MLGKNPGVRILWLWAIGTAGVLVTTVVKSRLRDMEALMEAQSKQAESMAAENVLRSDGTGGEVVEDR
ncbi:hypothetical protein EJ110_NYTH13666 [Nymphaea thermarum]|nr:hypothetical protein EJ110_NYTH13666 [Nymphaea thermarum]